MRGSRIGVSEGEKGKSFGLTGRTRDKTRRGQDKTVAVNLRELVRTEPYLKRNFHTGPEVTANCYSTLVGHLTPVNTPNNSFSSLIIRPSW